MPSTSRETAYLLLGTNLGDRRAHLHRACALIETRCGVLKDCSQVWRTAAWGIENQPDFLNLAVALETTLPADALLKALLAIELEIGRVRRIKWASRLIDIDILLYGDHIIDRPHLKVPHPFMTQRNFALGPLSDLAGTLCHPLCGRTIDQLYRDCPDPLPAAPEPVRIF